MTWVPLLLLAIDEFFKRALPLVPDRDVRSRDGDFCRAPGIRLLHDRRRGHLRLLVSASCPAKVACACRLNRHVFRCRGACGRATAARLGRVARKRAQGRPALRRGRQVLVPAGKLDHAIRSRHLRRYGAHDLLGTLVLLGDVAVRRRDGLVLAVYGGLQGERPLRRFGVPMVLLLLLLASADYTPLFYCLYHYVPGFQQFPRPHRGLFSLPPCS